MLPSAPLASCSFASGSLRRIASPQLHVAPLVVVLSFGIVDICESSALCCDVDLAQPRCFRCAMSDLREVLVSARYSVVSQPSIYMLTSQSHPAAYALLQKQSVPMNDGSLLELSSSPTRDLMGTLARLRERHPRAVMRFVSDRPDRLQEVAKDSRLLSIELYIAEWSYAETEWQRSLIDSTPRAQRLASGSLERVFEIPRKRGIIYRFP